ncbi:MAG: site-specific DNA-methyltransferase [Actinomycetota bacterium]
MVEERREGDQAREDGRDDGRRGTRTSTFGVGRRESHDAAEFYARFTPPVVSDADEVAPHVVRDALFLGEAQKMTDDQVADDSVALVVTSPPYFAGKEYETAMGQGHIPGSYREYLGMLHDVFERCAAKLEPGGRIAVNVANLGRKPYRSLSSDVVAILESLGLLLRGEIIWQKQKGATGSTAWGSYQSPTNPVLRDITERIVIAGKGRFDRAHNARERRKLGLPWQGSIRQEDFLDQTLDVWDIPAESATRVGHPAPFPVELPSRLIDLYTYYDDLVLDPFMGAGSTAVAAVRSDRHFVGFDTDEGYLELARARIDEEVAARAARLDDARPRVVVVPKSLRDDDDDDVDEAARVVGHGRKARDLAEAVLESAGFEITGRAVKPVRGGIEVPFVARDERGREWWFDVGGVLSAHRPGLQRTDAVWKAIGRAAALAGQWERRHAGEERPPLVLLTTHAPAAGSVGDDALAAMTGPTGPICDVIELLDAVGDLQRLEEHARGGS